MPNNNISNELGHDYWMRKAIEMAQEAEKNGEVPVGAVIVKNNKLIGKGYNQVITLKDASAHAEVQAIRDASKFIDNYRVVDTVLYVTLEPCMMCVGMMVHARIGKIVFGAYDQKTGVVQTRENCFEKPYHNHSVHYLGGVLELDCARLLKNFFKNKRMKKSRLE